MEIRSIMTDGQSSNYQPAKGINLQVVGTQSSSISKTNTPLTYGRSLQLNVNDTSKILEFIAASSSSNHPDTL